MTSLFVLPFRILVVLASSTSGDQHFFEIVKLFRPPPHQDWGRARTAGSRTARDDKEPGPSWEKQLLGERLRGTAETWHMGPQPSRHVQRKDAAPQQFPPNMYLYLGHIVECIILFYFCMSGLNRRARGRSSDKGQM
jgi:hypothetical protein